MSKPKTIKKLDKAVINRIAAGEIIQRPGNALKEMIENSLDAKSSNIQITVKEGGLKMLQIQDNGTGIRKEDLEIVCERFTTSKLREFEDLQTIATYGFRGEALASISHIAHLTIISKTERDICAYKADFIDGKIKEPPKPVAGTQGTIITVQDLFYNMNVRKRALRSPTEEYQKVSDIVSKYAIHNSHVGFSLKKANESVDIKTQPNSDCIENIRIIYGNTIAKELVEFKFENDEMKFQISGYITNVNYNTKKFVFLLFINHRLVDCQNLKRSIDQVYSTYLPKNAHPFIYLSLELDPISVDVNVHPTKHEVHFLNEEQIVESICTALEAKLLGSNNSRVFYTQAKLPGVHAETFPLKDADTSLNKSTYPKEVVRTDAREQKLEKFFGCAVKKDVEQTKSDISVYESALGTPQQIVQCDKSFEVETVPIVKEEPKKISNISAMSKLTRIETQLTSVLELRMSVEENCHRTLRDVFAQHVFVGAISPTQALIQYSTKLFLCNTQKIMQELFYQLILYNFQNFGLITLSEPLSIYELAMLGLDLPNVGWTPDDGDKSELATKVSEILVEKAEMLNEYFSMEIDSNGNLISLPLVFEDFKPEISGLPLFLIRSATEVNWESEKECFASFAKETAQYYSQISEELTSGGNDWKWITEHIFYATIRDYFIPPKQFTDNCAILEVANLPNLYKVFERC